MSCETTPCPHCTGTSWCDCGCHYTRVELEAEALKGVAPSKA